MRARCCVVVVNVIIIMCVQAFLVKSVAAVDADADARLSCAECRAITTALVSRLRALEGVDDVDARLRSALGAASRGRRMTHGRSELKITRAIDDACEDDAIEGFDSMLSSRCRDAFGAEGVKDAIENEAFARGPTDVAEFACVSATGACNSWPASSTHDEL
mmetsp:Transcript_3982/g.14469  ORF Transcript_3982/g.14469 Transcript_3982/m.14469 type:complete len:162 (+) Transcript_3982:115-600(+)